jgi:hypothetical protein
MNYTDTLKSLEHASLFDLYRLSVAIHQRMNDPELIRQVKRQIQEGESVTYFDATANGLEKGVILQKNPKYVVLKNEREGKTWRIAYYLLNVENKPVDIHATSTEKLSKMHFKVGEYVGFQSDRGQITSMIIRLNSKTVTMLTKDNRRWRVSYSLLFKVIDAELDAFFKKQGLNILSSPKDNPLYLIPHEPPS